MSGSGTPVPPQPPPKPSVPLSDAAGSYRDSPAPYRQSAVAPTENNLQYKGVRPPTVSVSPFVPIVTAPESGWLPAQLQDKATQDLRHILQDSELQNALLNNPDTSHPSVVASQSPLKQLLHNNHDLATSLQELEIRLKTQRSFTQSRLLALRALEQQHRTKISETEKNLQLFSPMVLYQRLAAGAQDQDTLLKTIVESFLEQNGLANEQELSGFLRRVRECKRTAFLRAERKQRWDEGRVGGWR